MGHHTVPEQCRRCVHLCWHGMGPASPGQYECRADGGYIYTVISRIPIYRNPAIAGAGGDCPQYKPTLMTVIGDYIRRLAGKLKEE